MKFLHGTTQTLTCVIGTWQSYVTLTRNNQCLKLTVNVQIGLIGPILQGFTYKIGDQICELNYRKTKSIIRDKVGDQFYNFAYFKLSSNLRELNKLDCWRLWKQFQDKLVTVVLNRLFANILFPTIPNLFDCIWIHGSLSALWTKHSHTQQQHKLRKQ